MKFDEHLKELFELLEIPSISAQKKHDKDIAKAADWVKNKLNALGFGAKVMPTKGHPVVYGELNHPTTNISLPTLLIYGHYDVQSPDPLKEWNSDPFKPEVRAGNIYARGVADDKGQLYTWFAALSELLKSKNNGPIANIKFLIEGEEEVGSKNLADFIEKNKPLLKADICVLSDTHCLNKDQPLIEYGLRGLSYNEVTISTFPKDIHSGIYGGNVLNPIQILSEIISKLKDDSGKILIKGFYDNVRKLNKKERKKLKDLPFREKEVLDETGAAIIFGEKEFNVHERAGARPTLDINGIWGGYTGEGSKTIIPSSASAKISMRLVPDQTPDEVFEKFRNYMQDILPKGAEMEIKELSTAEPVIVDTEGKYFKKAEKAYKKVFGKDPIYGLSGGTIGVVADLKNIMGMDSILMGYGLPDDGLHSPNEKFSLEMFEKGIETNIEFLNSFKN